MKSLILTLLLLAIPRSSYACVFDTITGVAFNGYDVLDTQPKTSSGSIKLLCVVGLLVTVDLGPGQTGTVAQRKLTRMGGGTSLLYNLFFDSARTQIWGNGANGTAHYGPVIAVLASITLPVYGAIPARQDVQTGTYNDSVQITINF
jgi:spore coat protein U-like protein